MNTDHRPFEHGGILLVAVLGLFLFAGFLLSWFYYEILSQLTIPWQFTNLEELKR